MSTILIVEDDYGIRDALTTALVGEGYTVKAAANGLEALKLIATLDKDPCVVLLDLMMPVMNGWEFLAECERKALLPNVPILVISAVGKAIHFARRVKFIAKPIELEDLLELCSENCPLPEKK